MDLNTLPGGSTAGFNLGMTAVHETGHWCGSPQTLSHGLKGRKHAFDEPCALLTLLHRCPSQPTTCKRVSLR